VIVSIFISEHKLLWSSGNSGFFNQNHQTQPLGTREIWSKIRHKWCRHW